MIRWIATIVLVSLLSSGCDSVTPSEDIPEVEWIQLPDIESPLIPGPDGELYRIRDGIFFRSSDHGDTWISSAPAVPDGWVRLGTPAVVTATGETYVTLYATSQDESRDPYQGIGRSTDGGMTFVDIDVEWLGRANWFVRTSGIFGDDANNIFVLVDDAPGGGSAIFHSPDGGDSWNPPDLQFDHCCTSISFSPDGSFYLVGLREILYRSMDRGDTWHALGEAPFEDALEISITSTQRIYVIGYNRIGPSFDDFLLSLFASDDEGTTWSRLDFFTAFQNVQSVAFGSNGHLFATVEQSNIYSIYRSTDQGQTWEEVNEGLPKSIVGNVSVRLAPVMMDADGYLYTGGGSTPYRTSVSVGGNE